MGIHDQQYARRAHDASPADEDAAVDTLLDTDRGVDAGVEAAERPGTRHHTGNIHN